MISAGTYTKQEIAKELDISTDRADNLIRKLKQLGYKVSTNGKRGKNYRIIISPSPQTQHNELIDFFRQYKLNYSEKQIKKIKQLLFSLGNNKGFSFRCLEHYNYFTDKTVKNYLDLFEAMGIVEFVYITKYYATKRREIDGYLTQEQIDKGDYTYVVDVKEITEEEYDSACRAFADFCEKNKDNKEMVNDEIIYFANQEKINELDGWFAQATIEGYYRLNQQFLFLLDTVSVQDYQRVRVGNHLEDAKRWEERVARWEAEKAERKSYNQLLKELEEAKRQIKELGGYLNGQNKLEEEM